MSNNGGGGGGGGGLASREHRVTSICDDDEVLNLYEHKQRISVIFYQPQKLLRSETLSVCPLPKKLSRPNPTSHTQIFTNV